MILHIELEVRGDKNKLSVGQPFTLDALKELLTLTPAEREADYAKAAEMLLHCALGLAMKAGDKGVDKLLAPFRDKPMEMRLCEQDHVILRANQPYIFTVDPECAHCKELHEASQLPRKEDEHHG